MKYIKLKGVIMLYHKEDRNIYLVMGLIVTFFIFMLISGAISLSYISKNTSATLYEKSID